MVTEADGANQAAGGRGANHSPALDDALGVFEAAFDTTDPVALGRSFLGAMARAARHPVKAAPAWARFGFGLGVVGIDTGARMFGVHLPGASRVESKDARFTSPAWRDNFLYHGLLESYLVTVRLLRELVHAARLEPHVTAKADFATQLLTDALAPTNYLLTNPAAMERLFETAGLSVVRGARNFARDVVQNQGWPSQVDRHAFALGREHRGDAGRGRVPQRADRADPVHAADGRRVRGAARRVPAVDQPLLHRRSRTGQEPGGVGGAARATPCSRSATAIPTRRCATLTFDDYLRLGPLTAIDVVREITGSETVNTLAICLGGTMNAMVLAYLDACGDRFVQLVDVPQLRRRLRGCGHAGDGVRRPRHHRRARAQRMERKGYLEGKDMAHTFDLLRANDLVFRYVVDGWLMGEPRPPSTSSPGTPTARTYRRRAHARLPALHVHRERAGARRVRRAGGAPDGVGDRHRLLHRGRGRGPHRAVAGVVPDHAAVQGPDAVRAHVGAVTSPAS